MLVGRREYTLTFQNWGPVVGRPWCALEGAHLVNHITLWMPAFVSAVTINLDELFEYCTIATDTFGREAR